MPLPARITYPYRLNPSQCGCPDYFATGNNFGVICQTCRGTGAVTEDQEAAGFAGVEGEESSSDLDLPAEMDEVIGRAA